MSDHCPKCNSANSYIGMDVLICENCGWMSHKVIMARTESELNTLMATKVMNWVEVNPRDSAAFWRPDNPFCTVNEYMAPLSWSPASDMTAVGDVIKQMKDDGYQLELRTYDDTKLNQSGVSTGCRFLTHDEAFKVWALRREWHPADDEGSGRGNTIPLALCRAALVAVLNVTPVDKADLQSTGT